MFEFGKTFNMKSVRIWITSLKPYSILNIKSVWIVSISKGRSLLVFLRSGMHFLAVGSNIRIVALCASLGNAKDLGEWRDCVGKTAADLKLLDKGEIIVSISYKWDALSRRSDEAYIKSYWNLTKQQIDETHIIVIVF